MRKFSEVQYIQLLLHPSERKIAIRPCQKNDVHSIRWRIDQDKPYLSKTISCSHFCSSLFQIMEWNPDYVYHVRGSWAARARDEIIVFLLTNAMPAAYVETVEETEYSKHRRVRLCPQEWQESFGDGFYDYAIDNSFYFLAPKTDWKADSKSVLPPGISQFAIKTEDELDSSIEEIKQKVGVTENG